MEKMTKQQIIEIGEKILERADVIAQHGTSINNALSIMKTGFNYTRTSMVMHTSKNVPELCTYGWKENAAGDAANVIISVPKTFFKQMLGYSDEEYQNWINNIPCKNATELLLRSLTTIEFDAPGVVFAAHVPKEFIKGTFIYTDNKNYLSFMGDWEAGMDHLTYLENEN